MSGLHAGITGLSDPKGSHLQGAVPHHFQHLPDVSFAMLSFHKTKKKLLKFHQFEYKILSKLEIESHSN